jgi:hypothetical protein
LHTIQRVLTVRSSFGFLLGNGLLYLVALLHSDPAWAQASIDKVNVYTQTVTAGNSLAFIIEVQGTNLESPEQPRVLVFPSAGITVTPVDHSATAIRVAVSAPQNYVPAEISLSYPNNVTISSSIVRTTCTTDDVKKTFFYVPASQVNEKYGTGVGKNFDVIQVSIVNECPLPVLIPLAGITIKVDGQSNPNIYPFSLDHVTSIFSYDRQFSGRRAVFFNIIQGTATVGSAIEPFLARGFTQGVSILGGGFTQAALTIWKDLTAEQLQNLASQSYQGTEQIGPNGGSLQKFLFLPKDKGKKKNDTSSFANKFAANHVCINMQIIPVLSPLKGS